MEATLDLTQVPQDQQYAALAQALESLPKGGAVAVLTAGGPQRLVRRLIAEHWGRFDWTPVAEEAGRWRCLLRRRETAPASLTEFFSADHERCDALYVAMEAAAQAGQDAGALFRAFDLALRRHIAMEEEGFFPQFDKLMGMDNQGPTAIMREEHAQMRGLLDRMSVAAADGDGDGLVSAGETLLMLIQQHNMKEEQMLYPMADEAFGAGSEDLLKQLVLY
jgi:uncharacterized protein (DUF2249 family)/hemerythrin-like domain-containing protein